MALKDWRAAIASAVTNGVGIPVHHWFPSVVEPPCAIVTPYFEYLRFTDAEGNYFGGHEARWSVILLVRLPSEAVAFDELDDLIDRAIPAIHTTDPPEGGGARVAVESVDDPQQINIGGIDYLAALLVVNTTRPNPTTP